MIEGILEDREDNERAYHRWLNEQRKDPNPNIAARALSILNNLLSRGEIKKQPSVVSKQPSQTIKGNGR